MACSIVLPFLSPTTMGITVDYDHDYEEERMYWYKALCEERR